MSKVTILGAGILGMSVAAQLPTDYDITIVGQFLPGDELDPRYTSQWAGAIWLGVHDCTIRDRQLQLESLMALWKLAGSNPESSIRRITMTEVMDYGSPDSVWYQSRVPNFRLLPQSELPKGAKFAMEWDTIVLTPMIFLPWMRSRLEKRGVTFKRMIVSSLGDLRSMGHDVLVNASGFGAAGLLDVQEKRISAVKQQNIRIRKPGYNKLYIRRGDNGAYYSTAFSRGDGTIYIGGIKTYGATDIVVNIEHRKQIMMNQHLNQPDVFPSPRLDDYDFITDHVGVFPYISPKDGGARVAKEIINGQRVVHAYGPEAGGFTYSFGIGREAARLVSDLGLFSEIKGGTRGNEVTSTKSKI